MAAERRGPGTVEQLKVILQVFLLVLLAGTVFRLSEYHLIASTKPWANHLGLAMATQY
jgi:hypothetical protein